MLEFQLGKSISEEEAEEYFSSKDWVCDLKLDGTRCGIEITNNGKIHLWGRGILKDGTQRDFSHNFPEIVEAVKSLNLPKGTILDGELNIDDNFNILQTRTTRKEDIVYYSEKFPANVKVFDVIKLGGKDYTKKSLEARIKALYSVLNVSDEVIAPLKFKFKEIGKRSLWRNVKQKKLEGIMFKNLNSTYKGERTSDWLKLKRVETYDGIVIGGLEGLESHKGTLGSLSVAQYKDGRLQEVASVSGINDNLKKKFWTHIKKYTSFMDIVRKNYLGKILHLEARKMKREGYFIIEFKAQDKAKNRYRHPRFLRVRTDKNLKDCVLEE